MMARKHGRRTGVALSMALAVLLAGCGGDDDDDDTATETTGTDTETEDAAGDDATGWGEIDQVAFCDAVIEAESLFLTGPELDEQGNPTPEGLQTFGEALQPLLEDVDRNTPEEIAADVDLVLSGVEQALSTGDPSATESQEFFEADAAIDVYVFDNCELDESHDVAAMEYGYEGVPETMTAGRIGIRLENQGAEVHEAVALRINDDVDMSFEELLELPEEEAQGMVEFKGVVFASPGESSSTVLELDAGRYGFLCFVPVGTTSMEDFLSAGPEGDGGTGTATDTGTGSGGEGEGGPPHFTQGMIAEFTVEG